MKKVKLLTALMLILAAIATFAGSVFADDVAGTNYENQYYSIKSADGFTKHESGKNCSWIRSDGVFYMVSVDSNDKSINARNLSNTDIKNYENAMIDKLKRQFYSGNGMNVNIDSVNAKKTMLNDCGAVRIEITYTANMAKSMSAHISGYLITTKNYIYYVLYQYQSGKEAAKPMLEDIVSSINVKDEKFSKFSLLKMGKLGTAQAAVVGAVSIVAVLSVISLIKGSKAKKYKKVPSMTANSNVFNVPPMENSMSSPLPPNMNYPLTPAAPIHPGSPNYPTSTPQSTAPTHPSSRPQPTPPASYGNPGNVDVSLYQGDPMYSVVPNRPQNSQDPDYAENVAKQSPHNATISAESSGYKGERINNNAPIHPLNSSYSAEKIQSNENSVDNSMLSQPKKQDLPKISLPNIADLEK